MDTEKILEEYRSGDQGKRLRLFLAFRDLRDDFSAIDEESPRDDFTIIEFPGRGKPRLARAA